MLFDHRESESLAMLFIYYFFTHFKYVYGEIEYPRRIRRQQRYQFSRFRGVT